MSPTEKLQLILKNNFSESEHLLIQTETKNVPLVAAKVIKATRSFSQGQLVYIYDGYWGMNKNAKIVGRFRRKQNWVRGVIPIKNLGDFRVKVVYEPTIIKKLEGESIDRQLFIRFLTPPKLPIDWGQKWSRLAKWISHWLRRLLGFPKRA